MNKEFINFFMLLVVIMFSIIVGSVIGRDAIRKQAIKNGHAERIIIDSLTGTTEFRWKKMK